MNLDEFQRSLRNLIITNPPSIKTACDSIFREMDDFSKVIRLEFEDGSVNGPIHTANVLLESIERVPHLQPDYYLRGSVLAVDEDSVGGQRDFVPIGMLIDMKKKLGKFVSYRIFSA